MRSDATVHDRDAHRAGTRLCDDGAAEAEPAPVAREGRRDVAEACFRFLPTRIELDLLGWGETDIFAHS